MFSSVAIVKKCKKGDGQEGKPYCLYSHEGKLLGRHKSKEDAYKQMYVVEKNGSHTFIAALILENVLDFMLCEGCD